MLEKTIQDSKPNYGVVLVDMQPPHLKKVCKSDRGIIIPAQQEVLETCIQREIPVLVFEYGRKRTIDDLRILVEKNPLGKILNKFGTDGFNTSDVGKYHVNYLLRKQKVTDLCFMGIYASACVLDTANGAWEEGFKILTAGGLIADKLGVDSEYAKHFFDSTGTYLDNYKDVLELLRVQS